MSHFHQLVIQEFPTHSKYAIFCFSKRLSTLTDIDQQGSLPQLGGKILL
jgi:hypothetical protein